MDSILRPNPRRILALVAVGIFCALAVTVSPMIPLPVMMLFMVPFCAGLLAWAFIADRVDARRLEAS